MSGAAVTFDEVWKFSQETSRQMRETARQMQATDRKIQETARQMQETDRKMQETDRKMQETDRKMQETDRLVKDLAKQVGNLAGRWGEFVEGVVAPACKTIFADRGIPVHKVTRRVEASLDDGRRMEIDLLVINAAVALLVEVKSKLTVADVRDHLKRLAGFKEFFPEYADKRVMGAVAGIVTEENADSFAVRKGLFVMVQSGEGVKLANDGDFIPRSW